jgi:hypothetical protein|tara:strand:+ start:248 stop:565 length:318 start_codon:yes stop_codon:yes gene_type:complete
MIKLPGPIAVYFDPTNSSADKALAFDENALVGDENRKHHGRSEIQKWMIEGKQKYRFTAEPIEIVETPDQVLVKAKVSGDFPNSPVELDYRFELVNDKIATLSIR